MRGEERDNSRSGIGFFVILIVLIILGVLVLKMCKPAKNKAKISQENTLSENPEIVQSENPPEITKETQISSEDFITGKVYFCRVSEDGTQKMLTAFRKISSTNSLESALKALLAGPTNAEESHDIVTNIPENTTLKSINIDNDIFGLHNLFSPLKIWSVFKCQDFTISDQINFICIICNCYCNNIRV